MTTDAYGLDCPDDQHDTFTVTLEIPCTTNFGADGERVATIIDIADGEILRMVRAAVEAEARSEYE